MEATKPGVEIVSFGGSEVTITPRKNGFYKLTWREARKGRSTTAVTLERARAAARKKVRELSGKAGSRTVLQIEAEAIEGLKDVIGARSLPGVVEQLRDAVLRLGGWEHVGRAFDNYIKAGHGKLDRSTVAVAVDRFNASHARSAVLYRAGMKKELQAGVVRFGTVSVCDLDAAMLEAHISRLNEDGSEPGARYFNNRLATWKTFLNRCRQWGMLLREELHAGETIKRRKEADRVPEIWGIDQAAKILQVVRSELNESLNYVVTGCWMGLRPFEMRRVTAKMWDWEQGYLNVGGACGNEKRCQAFSCCSREIPRHTSLS